LNDTGPYGLDINRAFHPKATEYTFFSSAHGTFSQIDHVLGHKIRSQLVSKDWDYSLHIFRPQCLKLERNHKRKFGKLKYMEAKEHPTKE